eukprot:6184147-Pleurochrysis_carterae.AAC.3
MESIGEMDQAVSGWRPCKRSMRHSPSACVEFVPSCKRPQSSHFAVPATNESACRGSTRKCRDVAPASGMLTLRYPLNSTATVERDLHEDGLELTGRNCLLWREGANGTVQRARFDGVSAVSGVVLYTLRCHHHHAKYTVGSWSRH